MKLDKLQVGQSFKNYKEMCNVLELEIKTNTNSKNAQYTEVARYCKYSRMGHKITIEEVFPEPIPKIENRGKSEGSRNNNTVYGDMIQLLILDLLAQCKQGQLSISRSKLMLTINMINSNYSPCGEQVKGLSKLTKIDEKIIYEFYNTSSSNFKSAVETALDKLMDKRIIWYDTVTKIRVRGTHIHRLATCEEKEIILEAEKQILDELGYKQVSLVRISKQWKLFRKKVKKLLHKDSNIDFYYFAYDINVNRKYLEEERTELLSFLLEDNKRKEYKGDLNNTVCENLMENTKKRKAKGFFASGKTYRLNEDYTSNMSELIDLLINKSADDIINDVISINEGESELTEEQMDLLRQLFA